MDGTAALALAPLLVAVLAFVGWCVADIVRHEVRVLPRWAWILITLASVPLGGIIYLLVGRGAAGPAPEPIAPDAPATDPSGAAVGSPPAMSSPSSPSSPPALGRSTSPAGGSTAPPVVRTDGLCKRYGDRLALDGVDLAVPRGSVYGLVGPNGSGKTTLLSVLCGLRRPTDGTITVGVDPDRVAVLPDTPTFDAWLTGREVVDLARSLSAPQLPAAAVTEALARTGLTDAADRRVGGYSRGMLQRLGLAATVVGQPELLLLDEPCSALDPLGRREVLDLIARLAGEATVLFCSHILGDVQEVCDTVGVLKDGRLLFQGPVDALLVGHASPSYTVRVRGAGAVDAVARALVGEPWVAGTEQLGAEELRVRARSLEEAQLRLVPLLATTGVRVLSVVPADTDLEHVFLELTR